MPGPFRIIPAAALLLVLSLPALAVEGRIVDATSGKPLANVTLSVVGGTQTARTDDGGHFFLVPDPRPPFDLLAVLPGGRYLGPIRIDALPTDGSWTVKLRPTAAESVTVTAGSTPGTLSAPASGTTVVSREDLRSRDSRNLTESLENVPGVNNVSEGHASAPAIRGLAQGRSLLLIDGTRVTSERRVGPSATFVDPFVLEGIEIARGPGSVAYGSDALGGVINARTRRPRPGEELSLDVEATLGYGVPQRRLGFAVGSGIGARSGVLFAAHLRNFDDYDSPEGPVINSGSEDRGFLLGYSRLVPGGLFSTVVQGDSGRNVERPRTDSDVVRFYYPGEDSLRFTASYETGPVKGFDSTSLSLFLGEYSIVTDQDRYPTATTPRRIERADVSARDFGIRASGVRHWGQAQLHFGLDFNGRVDLRAEEVVIDYDPAGSPVETDTLVTIDDARRIDTGVYVTAEGAVARTVSLGGGLRYDRVRSTNEGGYFGDLSVTNAEPSGYAAVTLGSFAGFSTTLQYSHGFRDARLSDRFYRGVTGAGFITGNPDLQAETSNQYDLALRYVSGRWQGAVYAYHYDIDNLIERYEDPNQPDFYFFRNRGQARIRGVELELVSELPRQVTLLINGSVTEGEALDDGTPLDDISPEKFVVQARKEFGRRVWVQLIANWAGELDEPGPNEIPLDSRLLIDIGTGWWVTQDVELQLLVRNLLDETYLLTADDRSPLAPGTSALLTVRYEF